MRCSWFYVSKNEEGYALKPVIETLEARRRQLLRKYFVAYEHAQAKPHGWITLGQHTAKWAELEWPTRPGDITFCAPRSMVQASTSGE